MLPLCLRILYLRSLVAAFLSLFIGGEPGADVDMRSGAHLPSGGTRIEDLPSSLLLLRDEGQTCTMVTSTEGICVDVPELQKYMFDLQELLLICSVFTRCVAQVLCCASWVLLQYSHLSFCLGTFISTAEGNTVWTVNSSPRSCKCLDGTCCCS